MRIHMRQAPIGYGPTRGITLPRCLDVSLRDSKVSCGALHNSSKDQVALGGSRPQILAPRRGRPIFEAV